ncbi:hypothetical protein IA69_13000 [Massilia sp. JS1662]|nr:hypothetical protein IA69_13000 [Massilia sp. JS1662]
MRRCARPGLVVVADFVVDAQDQVIAVAYAGLGRLATLRNAQLGAEVAAELEAPARLGRAIVAPSFEILRVRIALAHALLREPLAVVVGPETVRTSILVDLVREDVALGIE